MSDKVQAEGSPVVTEATLRDRERELSQLVDLIPSHVWRLAPDGEPIFFNKRMVDFFGFDVPDIEHVGMSRLQAFIEASIHPEDARAFRGMLDRCLLTGEAFYMRYRARRVDGAYRWMSSRAEPTRGADERIIRWYGLCHDIHDQVQAEEALRRSEQELQQMVDAVPVRLWRASASGEMPYFNNRYREYLRTVVPDLDAISEDGFGKLMLSLIHPEDAPEMERMMRQCFGSGTPFTIRFRRVQKDGSYRWEEGRVEPLRDQDGRIIQWYGVALDIDDEIRAQDGLRHASDRLARANQAASLSELSASIAHEVNQPLAAIVANSHACHRWLSAVPPNAERAKIAAERIVRDANAASDIVNRIRALFKQSIETRRPIALDGVIAEVRGLLEEEASRRRVRLDVDVQDALPPVTFDPVQMQQVLINLIRNGMDAMDSVARNRILQVRARLDQGAIRTEVSDHGRGIEFPDRMFEPFFTTKESGMGMGLAICRSIVESHGGRLWAEANEPQGARFVFTVPIEANAGNHAEA